MKPRFALTVLLAAAAAGAVPAQAQSISGTWTITSEGRRGPVTQTLVLAQDGSSLTGTVSFTGGGRRGGGGGGGPQSVQISNGSVEGNTFRFTMTLEFQGNSFSQQYAGTVEGDTIMGTIEGGRGGSQPFTGTRGG